MRNWSPSRTGLAVTTAAGLIFCLGSFCLAAVDLDSLQPEDEIYAASAQILLDGILEDLNGDQHKQW